MVPGCLGRGECVFFPCCSGRLGQERIVPHSVVGHPVIPRVLAHMRTGNAQLSGHNLESGAGHCWLVCGGLHRTPDASMVY